MTTRLHNKSELAVLRAQQDYVDSLPSAWRSFVYDFGYVTAVAWIEAGWFDHPAAARREVERQLREREAAL